MSSITAKRTPSAGIFSSFSTTAETENPHRPAFGKKELRFDGQMELKEYFNRDAGPGTYGEIASTMTESLASELKKIKATAKLA
jgi:hypothetical protein